MDDKYFISFRMGFSPRSLARILIGLVVFFVVLIAGTAFTMWLNNYLPFLKSLVELTTLIFFGLGLLLGKMAVNRLVGEPPSSFLRFDNEAKLTIWPPSKHTRQPISITRDQIRKSDSYWVHAERHGRKFKFPRHWMKTGLSPDQANRSAFAQPSLPTEYFEFIVQSGKLICNEVRVKIRDGHADKREARYWPREDPS